MYNIELAKSGIARRKGSPRREKTDKPSTEDSVREQRAGLVNTHKRSLSPLEEEESEYLKNESNIVVEILKEPESQNISM